MLKTRVIPILLMKGNGLYKGSKFGNEKYVGDPINTLKIFNEKEVDEIIVIDIDATMQKRGPNLKLIESLTSECFMPLCYGGGITTIEEMERLFYAGIEKISLNASAILNTKLISEASAIFGAQAIVASMDVKKAFLGGDALYTHRGTKKHSGHLEDWAKKFEQAGAGEILLTSIDREGTGIGYNYDLIEKISSAVSIPVIASGGASTIEHFSLAKKAGASAVAAGDMFTFYGKHKAVLIQYPKIDELAAVLNE